MHTQVMVFPGTDFEGGIGRRLPQRHFVVKYIGAQAVVGGGESRSEKNKIIRRPRKRIKNPISLRAAVNEVTKAKALTKKEILAEVGKLGYKFAASDPVNSLNTILYGKPKFKNNNGKFSTP